MTVKAADVKVRAPVGTSSLCMLCFGIENYEALWALH